MDDKRRASLSLKHTDTYRGSRQPSQVDGVPVPISDDSWLSLVSLDNRTYTSLTLFYIPHHRCRHSGSVIKGRYVMHHIIICSTFLVCLVIYLYVIMSSLRQSNVLNKCM